MKSQHLIALTALILGACSLINSAKQFADDAGVQAADAGLTDAGCELMCDGICTDTQTDPLHCGSCATSCSAPEHGAAVCTDGSCDITCDSGYVAVLGSCVPRVAPRPVAPLSTSTATSRRPTFRWELAARTDGARIEICADRACTVVLQTIDASGSSGRPTSDLPPGVVFWRLYGRDGAEVGLEPSVTWQVYIGARSAEGELDTSWGTTLDVDGDGFADVIVGSGSADSSNAGRVYIYRGAAVGPAPTPTVIESADEGFGSSVASAGDVNGDGYADLIVGADDFNAGAGRVHIYRGGPTGLALTPLVLDGLAASDHFGASVASAGDVDRDGYADVLVGAPGADSTAGRAYLYHGSASGLSPAPTVLDGTEGASFGSSVAGAGDIDGDGYADVIIGARNFGSVAGRAYLYRGGASGLSSTPDILEIDASRRAFGHSVASADDVNGDGYADVLIGAPLANSYKGGAYLYLGGASGLSSTPTALAGTFSDGDFGESVGGANDVDGDGYADIIIGAPGADFYVGRAYLYRGSASGLVATPTVLDNGPDGGEFGGAVACAGDVDGDGHPDVIIGADSVDSTGGRAYVYRGGADGLESAPWVLDDGAEGEHFGRAVASAADLDDRGANPTRGRADYGDCHPALGHRPLRRLTCAPYST